MAFLNFFRKLHGVENRVSVLELDADGNDSFKPFFPTPRHFSAGVLPEVAESYVNQLKHCFMLYAISESNAFESSRILAYEFLVALVSASGEGGVGKPSTCELQCVDFSLGKYFASGAIFVDFSKF